jgi:hypothetical protein
MQTPNVRTRAADSGKAELPHCYLCQEQREFAKTIGVLLADKWMQAHFAQRADSKFGETRRIRGYPYAATR